MTCATARARRGPSTRSSWTPCRARSGAARATTARITALPGERSRLRGLAAALALAACAAAPASAETVLRVMTFNTWGAGANAGKPVDETAAVIRAAGADIVGIQETRQEAPDCSEESCPPASESIAAKLAAALGFHYYD